MYSFTFLGTANAFYDKPDNFQSNVLIESESSDQALLIDCGGDARRSLALLKKSYRDITHVYISHLHSDHIGGLEWLALSHKFDNETIKPTLYCEESIMHDLWNHSLKGGLSTLSTETSLESYFTPTTVYEKQSFEWNGLKLTPIQSIHTFNNNKPMPCFGLFIQSSASRIFYTSDSRYTPDIHFSWFKQCDLIFHDCETSETKSGVHANYQELIQYPDPIKNKMHLYHYASTAGIDPKQDGFKSFAKPHECFNFE